MCFVNLLGQQIYLWWCTEPITSVIILGNKLYLACIILP